MARDRRGSGRGAALPSWHQGRSHGAEVGQWEESGHWLSQVCCSFPGLSAAGTPGRGPLHCVRVPIAAWPRPRPWRKPGRMGSRELSQVGLAAWFREWNFLVATCLEGTQSQGRRRLFSGGIWPQWAKNVVFPAQPLCGLLRPLLPGLSAPSRLSGLRRASRARPAPCQEWRLLGTWPAGRLWLHLRPHVYGGLGRFLCCFWRRDSTPGWGQSRLPALDFPPSSLYLARSTHSTSLRWGQSLQSGWAPVLPVCCRG